MTNIRQILAINIKQNRLRLGISQARLAEKANASTQYIAMIEIERKFPSPEMLERIALALEIDTLELFTPPSLSTETLKNLQKAVITDLEKSLIRSINKTVRETVSSVIKSHSIEPNINIKT